MLPDGGVALPGLGLCLGGMNRNIKKPTGEVGFFFASALPHVKAIKDWTLLG